MVVRQQHIFGFRKESQLSHDCKCWSLFKIQPVNRENFAWEDGCVGHGEVMVLNLLASQASLNNHLGVSLLPPLPGPHGYKESHM